MYTIADDSSSIGIGNHRHSSFLGCVRTSVIWSRMMGQNIPSRKPRERAVILDKRNRQGRQDCPQRCCG
uniref:Uncharacterized protein n=1 Tax=Helianthus annuus TaxID=4232 RepID=A0A251SAE0_HELAN